MRFFLLLFMLVMSNSALHWRPPSNLSGSVQSEFNDDAGLLNSETRKTRSDSSKCYDLSKLPTIEALTHCTGETLQAGIDGLIDISNATQSQVNTIFWQTQSEKRGSASSIIMNNNQEVETLDILFRIEGHDLTFTVKGNRNLKDLNALFIDPRRSSIKLEIRGNRKLTAESIQKLTAAENKVISYIQEEGECINVNPLSSFDDLEDCKYTTTGVEIDANTDYITPFPRSLKKIKGCLKIVETDLENVDFITNNNIITESCRQNEISGNRKLCIHPEQREKIRDILKNAVTLEGNYDCDGECTSEYLLRSKNQDCKIITDTLEIKDQPKDADLNHLNSVQEIRGRLVIKDNYFEWINFLKKLTFINATNQNIENAVDIKWNVKLTTIEFPSLNNIKVDKYQKAFYIADNGKYKMPDSQLDELQNKFGADSITVIWEKAIRPKEPKKHAIGNQTNVTVANKIKGAGKPEEDMKIGTTHEEKNSIAALSILIALLVLLLIGASIVVAMVIYIKWKKTMRSRYYECMHPEIRTLRKPIFYPRKLSHMPEDPNEVFKKNMALIKKEREGTIEKAKQVNTNGKFYEKNDNENNNLIQLFDEESFLDSDQEEGVSVDVGEGTQLKTRGTGIIAKKPSQATDMRKTVGKEQKDFHKRTPWQLPYFINASKNARKMKEYEELYNSEKIYDNLWDSTKRCDEERKTQKKDKKPVPINGLWPGHLELAQALKKYGPPKKEKNTATSGRAKAGADKRMKKRDFNEDAKDEDSGKIRIRCMKAEEELKKAEEAQANKVVSDDDEDLSFDSFLLDHRRMKRAYMRLMNKRTEKRIKHYEAELQNKEGNNQQGSACAGKRLQKDNPNVLTLKEERPIEKVNPARKRTQRAVIDHLNNDAPPLFLSPLEKERWQNNKQPCKCFADLLTEYRYGLLGDQTYDEYLKNRCNCDNKAPYNILQQVDVPTVFVQPFKYTAKRMMSKARCKFEENISRQEMNKLKQTFDIQKPKILNQNRTLGDKVSKVTLKPSVCVSSKAFQFVADKKSSNGDGNFLIKVERPRKDNSDPNVFLRSMIECLMSNEMGNWIMFKHEDILELCKLAKETLVLTKRAMEYLHGGNVRIIGEIRGIFDDLRKALCVGNKTSDSDTHPMFAHRHVFLGGYVGNGAFNVETICLVFAMRAFFKNDCVLLRGMTDWSEMNKDLVFSKELENRYPEHHEILFEAINDVFDHLPLVCQIATNAICSYGGIVPGMEHLKDKQLPEKELVPNTLSFNLMFTHPNYTVKFPEDNYDLRAGYYLGMQSHEELMKKEGYQVVFASKCLASGWGDFSSTKFSLYSVCSGMNLEGASDQWASAVADIDTKGNICFNVIYQMEPDVDKTYAERANPRSSAVKSHSKGTK